MIVGSIVEKNPLVSGAVTELSGGGGGGGMIPALALEMNHLFSSSDNFYRVLWQVFFVMHSDSQLDFN